MSTMSTLFGLDRMAVVAVPPDSEYAHVRIDDLTIVCRDTESIDKVIASLQIARARLMAAKIAEAKL